MVKKYQLKCTWVPDTLVQNMLRRNRRAAREKEDQTKIKENKALRTALVTKTSKWCAHTVSQEHGPVILAGKHSVPRHLFCLELFRVRTSVSCGLSDEQTRATPA
jgi:hypothetical protein